MRGKIKSSEFMQFDFWTAPNAGTPINLNCSYDFKPQYPKGTDDKILAIVVNFRADAPEDVVHFHAQCRVIFEFSEEDDLPNEDDLITENHLAAYQRFCEKTNEAMLVLGQNPFDFHEI